MARPLATAYKSIKTQTQKLLPLFNSITARKTACNSAYQANLSSRSSEWWKMLSIHLGTTIHKPSSFLFVGYELFIGYCPSDKRIHQLVAQFQDQSQGKRGSLLLSIYLLLALPRQHDPIWTISVLLWTLLGSAHSTAVCLTLLETSWVFQVSRLFYDS